MAGQDAEGTPWEGMDPWDDGTEAWRAALTDAELSAWRDWQSRARRRLDDQVRDDLGGTSAGAAVDPGHPATHTVEIEVSVPTEGGAVDELTATLRSGGDSGETVLLHRVDGEDPARYRSSPIALRHGDDLLAATRLQNEALERAKDELEQSLRERTAALELAIEQMESADTIIDRWSLDGTINYMNQFGLDTFGYTAEEVVGKPAIGSIVPDTPARLQEWRAVTEQIVAEPNRNHHSELLCKSKDGSPVWVAFRNRPILDADNNITEIFSVGIDITERRMRETELREAKDRMETELNIGRDIQMSMLPLEFPAFPDRSEFTVFAKLEPAREVGGDFYDFFLIDDHHLCFCVGDVSDKGVPAALMMAVTTTLITSRATNDSSPASILTHVNDELCRRNESSMFVTLFVCILDLRSGEMQYTNAGHNPPYVKRRTGDVVKLDERHGPVAGALEGMAYGGDTITLEPGDRVLLFTDGVTEAMDPDHELYTEERLETLLDETGSTASEDLVGEVFASVKEHQGRAEQSDDITILSVRFDGTATDEPDRLGVSMENRLDDIPRVLDEIGAWIEGRGIDDSVRRTMLLVLDDLLANVVIYAYQQDDDKTVDITVERFADRLSMTVADDGRPFNPFGVNAPDVTASIEERGIGGLGIHLMRTMMDEYEYTRRTGRNVVTVVKRLQPGPDEGASQ